MDLAKATLDLIEAWIEKTKRDRAVRRGAKVIVQILLKAWRKQAKGIIARLNTDLHAAIKQREAVSPAVRKLILRMLLPAATKAALKGFVGSDGIQAFDSAIRGVMRQGGVGLASQLLASIKGLDLTREEKAWIKQHGFVKLAADIDAYTKDLLATRIGEAYQSGATYEQIVQAIETAGAFDRKRAELIASTELNAAYNQGGLAMARQLGATAKRWDPLGGEVCDICLENEAESFIPLEDDFASGDDCPPAHPNCECVLEFSFLEEERDEKDAPST